MSSVVVKVQRCWIGCRSGTRGLTVLVCFPSRQHLFGGPFGVSAQCVSFVFTPRRVGTVWSESMRGSVKYTFWCMNQRTPSEVILYTGHTGLSRDLFSLVYAEALADFSSNNNPIVFEIGGSPLSCRVRLAGKWTAHL